MRLAKQRAVVCASWPQRGLVGRGSYAAPELRQLFSSETLNGPCWSFFVATTQILLVELLLQVLFLPIL